MIYTVLFTRAAAKDLAALDRPVRTRVVRRIEALADHPRPPGCTALQGLPGYRIRIGDWRVLYTVTDETVTVLVVRVGPRGQVYRH